MQGVSERSKRPLFTLGEEILPEKKRNTRQDTRIEATFNSLIDQCTRKTLTLESITGFVSARPSLPFLEKLFDESVRNEASLPVITSLLTHTLEHIHTAPNLIRIFHIDPAKIKTTLKQMFDNAVEKKLPDDLLLLIINKLLTLDHSVEELILLSLEISLLGRDYTKSKESLANSLETKIISPERLSSFLYNFLTQDNSLDVLLFLANVPQIVAVPEEISKLTKPLISAFIKQSDDPVLKTFSLDFFEDNHPDLYSQITSWISRFEKGLIYTDDFKSEDTRSTFVSSVITLLKFAEVNKEFREFCSTELTEALSTCKDQASLFLNNLLLQKQVIESRGKPLNEMLPIFKRKIAIEALREFTKSYVEVQEAMLMTDPRTAGNLDWFLETRPDPVVVQLDLECRLKNELDLKGAVTKHLFATSLTPDDVEEALQTVESITKSPFTLASRLVQNEPHGTKSIWVQELLKRKDLKLTEKIKTEQATLQKLQSAAYDVNIESAAGRELEEGEIDEQLEKAEAQWTRRFSKLSYEQKNLFNDRLNDIPNHRLYEKRSHAIQSLFGLAEQKVVRSATLDILYAG